MSFLASRRAKPPADAKRFERATMAATARFMNV
jgi:hypothetical protein